MTSHERPSVDPIAIVGIGCRLPGGADSPELLWRLLGEEFDAIGPIPASRFDADALFDERAATPGHIASRFGGFLEGIEDFDAAFFGISAREAERLDPQQRLLLETSWEALDDAGIPQSSLAGTNAGVYVGMWTNEFESRMFADRDDIDFYMTTGSGRYAASGRLSYFLDARGPSVTVDTACSSSLVAVHLACQSLREGECDIALAGGANVILDPTITIAYSQSRMMAPDGRCKFGDVTADGYVRSDGAAMVVLKRLSSAIADGDHMYAVIRGSAVTNDGSASGSLPRPGRDGHEAMLRNAYARAGVDPHSVQYVEAHGTGTVAGDRVELGALGAVLGIGRPADDPCLVGSIKTNVGHTEGAAGVAGLIKAALALDHRQIPASLHLHTPNPSIAWTDLRLEVCTKQRPWPVSPGPARAGVSAFGITGTNAHAVLEEAPSRPLVRSDDARAQALVISANDDEALHDLAHAYLTVLADDDVSCADVCAAASQQRSHLYRRLAVVGADATALSEGLTAHLRHDAHPALTVGVAATAPRVVFVFPGQGSQWPGMARELLIAEPVFRDAMHQCDRAIRAEAGWSPLEKLAASSTDQLEDIDVVQPLLFAVQVALAAQWRAWGIEPVAVVGHSMGEVAAAHVSGALSLEQATSVICRRSALLRRVRGQGAMAMVELTMSEATEVIAAHATSLSVAVNNSPRSTVISGDPPAIDAVLAELARRGVFCRRVQVDVASHSPQMDPLLDDLRLALIDLVPGPAHIPFHSTVDGSEIDGRSLDAEYWARNLRQPVRFGDAVARLAGEGLAVFLEISPHPILVPAIEQVLQHDERDGRALASLRRGEPERMAMLGGLAALHVAGAPVIWPAVVGIGRPVRLPGYAWQRARHWHEPRPSNTRTGGHRLLGHGFHPAADPQIVHWETNLDRHDLAFLRDHVVHGSAIMPAAGFVELALSAAAEIAAPAAGPTSFAVESLTLVEALPVEAGYERSVQLSIEGVGADLLRFRTYSQEHDGAASSTWRLHAHGSLRRTGSPPALAPEPATSIVRRCDEHLDAAAHYARMSDRDLEYSEAFRMVHEVWIGDGEAVGKLQPPAAADHDEALRIVILDGALQIALAAMPAATAGERFLPVEIERILVRRPVTGQHDLWAHATVTSSNDDRVSCDVTVIDPSGVVIIEAEGVQLRRTGGRARQVDDLLYELQWRPAERSPGPDAGLAGDTWILFTADDVGRDLAARLTAAGAHCLTVTPGGSFRQIDRDHFVVRPGVSADHREVLGHVLDRPGRVHVAYAWAAAIPSDGPEVIRIAEELGCAGPVALVQALGTMFDSTDGRATAEWPRLWLITRDAQSTASHGGDAFDATVHGGDAFDATVHGGNAFDATVHGGNAFGALAWGVGRVVASEMPSLDATLIDVSSDAPDDRDLFDELWSGSSDRQVALRPGARQVLRLARMPRASSKPAHLIDAEAHRLAVKEPGSLESLHLRVDARRVPAAHEIEVRVEASGLNFLDVLKAMGIYPGLEPSASVALGAECAGVVVAVGSDVHEFAVGDDVVAITPSYNTISMISAFVTVPAAFAAKRPANLSAAEAAALPVAYLTAYYALHELGRVQPGERVLVHSASGGVGLAALQICRHLGAELIATAGTEAKREHLRGLGIEHVFDSRTLEFADQVRACTGGRGVDVVLNSLTGAAIPAGLSTLASRGRFIEIGKRDVYDNTRLGLELFKNNLAYSFVDLAALTEHDPHYVSTLFRQVIELISQGHLPALPVAASPVTAASAAFRSMAQSIHIGKVVLTATGTASPAESAPVRADSTYVITGGLGGLGLAVARRFVERGARHLALLGRSAPSAEATRTIHELRSIGATVTTFAVDVGDAVEVDRALGEVRRTMPAMRGIVHAAGSLADATLAMLDTSRLHSALAPKLAGGWNLHRATADDPLDFFVMFSSASAVLGLAGQANYAAGNAYLDALAHQRGAAGEPALSIEWGPWSQIGLAAEAANRGDRLASRGLDSVNPTEALDALEELLDDAPITAAVMRFDAARWIANEPDSAALLGGLVVETDVPVASRGGILERLLATPIGARRRMVLEDAVSADLAVVVRIDAHRVDRHRPLKAMGLDSLMALELRNRLEAQTGLQLSATIAWNYPTVAVLAEHLAERMHVALDANLDDHIDEGADAAIDGTIETEDADDATSRAELEALLSEELAAVDRLLNNDGRPS